MDAALEHERWCRARDRLRLQRAQLRRGRAADTSALGLKTQRLLAAAGLGDWEAKVAEAERPAATLAELGKRARGILAAPAEAATAAAAQQLPVSSPATQALTTPAYDSGAPSTAAADYVAAATAAQYAPGANGSANGQWSAPANGHHNAYMHPYSGEGNAGSGAAVLQPDMAAVALQLLEKWQSNFFPNPQLAASSASKRGSAERRSSSGAHGPAGGAKRYHKSPPAGDQPAPQRACMQAQPAPASLQGRYPAAGGYAAPPVYNPPVAHGRPYYNGPGPAEASMAAPGFAPAAYT